MKPARLILVCVTALTLATLSAADLTLVRDGAPAAQIVIPAEAPEFVTLAAGELNLYLQKMSGAELPIVTEPADGVAQVVLGVPDDAWATGAELSTLTFDGFVVECEGERLVLAGNLPEGTLNAVYWLLEELGVRWFIPTDLGENVPELATVTIPTMNTRVEPRFACRRNHGIDNSIRPDGDIWRRRVRITSHALNVPFNRYSHHLYAVFPVAKYGETHPEYYPLINGERLVPELSYHWQPCTSNPEVVQLTIEAARKWFDEHPERNYFSVGMNDGRGWCECDNCTALDIPDETFRGRKVVSDRYFTFVKQVADAVAQTHPDKFISCIAYSSVEPLPKNVEIPDNVMVVITQDVAQWHDPAYKQMDQDFARGWAEAAGAFGTYDYTGLTWTLPRVYPHLMAESLRFYDEVGAVAVTNEAFPTWWYAGPMMYLRAKLMWDPQQDPDAVLGEFYTGFFGPASEPMKRLYDQFETCLEKERDGLWFEGLGSVLPQIDLWTPADLQACVDAIADARRLAGDAEPYAARVEFVAGGFAWTDAILREYWLGEALAEASSSPDTTTDEFMTALETFLVAGVAREDAWARIAGDDLISGIYNLLVNQYGGRQATWRAHINRRLTQGLSAMQSRADEMDPARLAQMVAGASDGVSFHLRTLVWVAENPDAPNLGTNPGFEPAEVDAAPEGIEWVATNAPPGWSKWSIDRKPERLTWEREGGRTEPGCARLTGARNACFVGSIPVKPGELCYASIWVKSVGSAEQDNSFYLKWQNADGQWTQAAAGQVASGQGGADRWQMLAVVSEVPEDAAYAILLAGAIDQQPDDTATYDDVRFIRLPEELRGGEGTDQQ